MKSGKCPKCNAREIFLKTGSDPRSNLAISMFRQAKLQDYVCTNCGYTEAYVIKSEDMNKIREKWKRIGY